MKSPSTIVLHCNDPKIDREGDTGRTKERQEQWRWGKKRPRDIEKETERGNEMLWAQQL